MRLVNACVQRSWCILFAFISTYVVSKYQNNPNWSAKADDAFSPGEGEGAFIFKGGYDAHVRKKVNSVSFQSEQYLRCTSLGCQKQQKITKKGSV